MRIRIIRTEENKIPKKLDGLVVKPIKLNKVGNIIVEYDGYKKISLNKACYEVLEEVLPISRMSNDLFSKILCPTCSLSGKLNMLRFYGYNDSFFFNTVNKEYRTIECPHCGGKHDFKWERNGLKFRARF